MFLNIVERKSNNKYSLWYFIMVSFVLFTICGCGKWNLDRVLCYVYPWSMMYYLLLCMYEILTTYVFIYYIYNCTDVNCNDSTTRREGGGGRQVLFRWMDRVLRPMAGHSTLLHGTWTRSGSCRYHLGKFIFVVSESILRAKLKFFHKIIIQY